MPRDLGVVFFAPFSTYPKKKKIFAPIHELFYVEQIVVWKYYVVRHFHNISLDLEEIGYPPCSTTNLTPPLTRSV